MYKITALPGPNNSESLAFGMSPAGGAVGLAFEPVADAGVIWLRGSFDFSLAPNSYSVLYRREQVWRCGGCARYGQHSNRDCGAGAKPRGA